MSDNEVKLLQQTPMLDFGNPAIGDLIEKRRWRQLSRYDRIGAAYEFVRNEIAFGYNSADEIAASRVLADGYGQCNTKATLLMALFRALEIPCRLHGFTIHKSLQRGVMPELVYRIAPGNIVHSWVEVLYNDKWINLEGFILDDAYVASLQAACEESSICAFGAGTDRLMDPQTSWNGTDTYIQRTGINADLGLFASPDEFYGSHSQQISGLRRLAYVYFIRHWMNRRVANIRAGAVPKLPTGRPHMRSQGAELM
ncbi:transglutaminase family protein [Nitratireductor sp. XY-223]|uniref:transglutaminase-like domain-containing protein n=1 Tax=Nitratireductor sp. XY-223 TaxID=2561926 RepID=UPI0010AA1477|nr:transglutaminase family protein [Nitratireductor sp. XY-223]